MVCGNRFYYTNIIWGMMVGGSQIRFIALLVYGSLIFSVKNEFGERIRYRVHNERQVKLLHDEWCGQQPLHSVFSNLYLLNRRHHAMVADYCRYVRGSVVWDFRFRFSKEFNR